MPCSTASIMEPPDWRAFKAASLAGFPKGQVDTISGTSPGLGLLLASPPRAVCSVAPLTRPMAAWPTNLRREIFMGSGLVFNQSFEVRQVFGAGDFGVRQSADDKLNWLADQFARRRVIGDVQPLLPHNFE